MAKATIISGVPGSGKSTLAKDFIEQGYYHLERDVIRQSVFDFTDWKSWDWRNEKAVTCEWESRLANLVYNNKDIVISDTLCKKRDRDKLVDRMKGYGYDVTVVVLDVPLEVLIDRDSSRGDFSVGQDVIKMMYRRLHEEN